MFTYIVLRNPLHGNQTNARRFCDNKGWHVICSLYRGIINCCFHTPMKIFLLFVQSKLTLAFAFNMQTECTAEYFTAAQVNYERLWKAGVPHTIPWITPICVFATDSGYVVLYSLFLSVHFCCVVLTFLFHTALRKIWNKQLWKSCNVIWLQVESQKS